MNRISFEKRVSIAALAVAGMGERLIARSLRVSANAVSRNLLRLGENCQRYHDKFDRNLTSQFIEMDELTSLIRGRAINLPDEQKTSPNFGQMWTWIAICRSSKFVMSWHCGKHELMDGDKVCFDLRARLARPYPQIFTDGLIHYHAALENAFGDELRHATIMKQRDKDAEWDSEQPQQAAVEGMRLGRTVGDIDPEKTSTGGVERFNLTLRTESSRHRKLTNTISQRIRHHRAGLALKMMSYNYARLHQTVRCTPAMEIGRINSLWEIEDFVTAMDSMESEAGST